MTRALAVLGAAAALVTVTGTAATAASSQPITRGNTQIVLNTHTAQAMKDHDFTLAPIPGATLRQGVLKLPTIGGTANPPNYVIKQGGGFSIAKNGTKVS